MSGTSGHICHTQRELLKLCVSLIGHSDGELCIIDADSTDEQFGEPAVGLELGGPLTIGAVSFRYGLERQRAETANRLSGLNGRVVARVDPHDVGLGVGARQHRYATHAIVRQVVVDQSDIVDAEHFDHAVGRCRQLVCARFDVARFGGATVGARLGQFFGLEHAQRFHLVFARFVEAAVDDGAHGGAAQCLPLGLKVRPVQPVDGRRFRHRVDGAGQIDAAFTQQIDARRFFRVVAAQPGAAWWKFIRVAHGRAAFLLVCVTVDQSRSDQRAYKNVPPHRGRVFQT